jgi:hypothetical protein
MTLRRWIRAIPLAALLTAVSLAAGVAAGAHRQADPLSLAPRVAEAQSCGSPGVLCTKSKQSLIRVTHTRTAADLPYYIEPQTGETWSATVVWASDTDPGDCQCTETTHQVTFRVDWVAPNWIATCVSGCDPLNGPVYGVDICAGVGCGVGLGRHEWEYVARLQVAPIRQICETRAAYLERVDYATTQVDNGRGIVGTCGLSLATYTPTSQVFTVTDTGAYQPLGLFQCYTLESCVGPTPVTIAYR